MTTMTRGHRVWLACGLGWLLETGLPAGTASASTGAIPDPPRAFAFVVVDVGGGSNLTAGGATATLMTNPDSLRNYYVDASYGRQDIQAQVFGPVAYSFPTTCTTNDMNALASALRPMIGGTFDHYLWYLGSRQAQCRWQGLASVGTPSAPSRDTWYNASIDCVVLVQEPGHNLGMQHSASLSCPGASFADDPNSCTPNEYGDMYDAMGNACRHMNAWQKAYQGWFGGCNGVAVTAGGTFTLLPLERSCDGAQFLKVRAARPRTFAGPAAAGARVETLAYYYVELRTPADFDGTLASQAPLTPQILIHAGDDLRSRAQAGAHTYLLDMTPATATFADAALEVGATFTDPAGGVSITTTAVSASQATISVDIAGGTGAATCLDGTTFPSPGPGPESCQARAVDAGLGGGAGPDRMNGCGCSTGRRSPSGAGGIGALMAMILLGRARARGAGAQRQGRSGSQETGWEALHDRSLLHCSS